MNIATAEQRSVALPHAGQPEDEAKAIKLVEQVGLEEVNRRYDAVCALAQERYDTFIHTGGSAVGFTPIDFLDLEELEERHSLLLGIMLCTDFKAEARKRVLERRAMREKAREARRQYAA